MNENIILKLYDFVGDSAFGNKEGREVYQKLLDKLDAHPDKKIIGISLDGITRTDASFAKHLTLTRYRCCDLPLKPKRSNPH